MPESANELGRRLVLEMRMSVEERFARENSATEQLHFDGRDLDDETLWSALLGALDEAANDSEMWRLADGYVTEIIMPRDDLNDRFAELCRTSLSVAEMARVMADPERNAWGDDTLGNQSLLGRQGPCDRAARTWLVPLASSVPERPIHG